MTYPDGQSESRSVTVGSFSIGATEVTQAQYQKVMGTNPSDFKGDNRPVEKVSWFDAASRDRNLGDPGDRSSGLGFRVLVQP